MQQLSDQDVPATHVGVPPRKRKTSARRKITVRISEGVCGRLDVATDRPGVGKSMFVEAALEHFMNPAPSVEDLVQERFDQMHARFDRFEQDMRTMAETVALQARYQLAVTPPIPQEQQREAVLLGDERFKIFAEQVDRRVRQHRPLMQETIDRLNSESSGQGREATKQAPLDLGLEGSGLKHQPSQVASVPAPGLTAGEARPDSKVQRRPTSSADVRRVSRNAEPYRSSTTEHSAPRPTERPETVGTRSLSKWRLILAVFLPFAAGYYLSFLFRTINAAISPALASEFGLDATNIGLMTSVYFLVFAGAQVPIGAFLDRFGPRRVQSVLLVLAAGGATLFGTATGFTDLLAGRALIGLGVAASLMAGLKATVLWFPKERIALVNGCMIMLGSLGAVTATAPTDWMLEWAGWRSLFELLTIATVAVAGVVYLVVPEKVANSAISEASAKPLSVWSVFSDSRFLRVAPLSAACIGSSWALQSLWAAPWLTDVEGLDRPSLMKQLLIMSLLLSLGALMLGIFADRLRKRGMTAEMLLGVLAALFMAAQLAIIFRVPLPSTLPWCVVSVMGAGTVLSYAIIAEYFPRELAARANGALNLVHFAWAFVAQGGVGLVVGQWSPQDGQYPAMAYQTAFGISVVVQAVALLWFATPWLRSLGESLLATIARPSADHGLALTTGSVQGGLLDPHDATEW